MYNLYVYLVLYGIPGISGLFLGTGGGTPMPPGGIGGGRRLSPSSILSGTSYGSGLGDRPFDPALAELGVRETGVGGGSGLVIPPTDDLLPLWMCM